MVTGTNNQSWLVHLSSPCANKHLGSPIFYTFGICELVSYFRIYVWEAKWALKRLWNHFIPFSISKRKRLYGREKVFECPSHFEKKSILFAVENLWTLQLHKHYKTFLFWFFLTHTHLWVKKKVFFFEEQRILNSLIIQSFYKRKKKRYPKD